MVEQQAIYIDRRCERNTIHRPQRPPVGEWSGFLDILLLHFATIHVCSSVDEAVRCLRDGQNDMLVVVNNDEALLESAGESAPDQALLRKSAASRPANTLLAGLGFSSAQSASFDVEVFPTSMSVAQAVSQLAQQDIRAFEKPEFAPTRAEWFALRSRMQYNSLDDKSIGAVLDAHIAHEAQQPEQSEEGTTALSDLISSWGFSCLTLSSGDVVRCVFIMFKHVLAQPSMEAWLIPDAALLNFIGTVQSGYHPLNPYHNFRHAVDVLQALFYFLLSSSALPPLESSKGNTAAGLIPRSPTVTDLFTPGYILALMIVGLGHDVGHPGVNNGFLVATHAPLALLFNDRSVLENLHGAALSRILLAYWPATQEPTMRKIILELVLSTDMALHFDYMSRFKEIDALRTAAAQGKHASAGSDVIDRLRSTIFAGLVKCADICNVARPLQVSKLWSSVLLREFFNQSRLERFVGLPLTKSFDPEQTVQADSQIFFMDMFAAPLFKSLKVALPSLEPLIEQMESNKAYWASTRSAKAVDVIGASPKETIHFAPAAPATGSTGPGCFSVFHRKRQASS